jgi:hypothetical protein
VLRRRRSGSPAHRHLTRQAHRTTIHPATVDGLWAAAVTGHYTAARCHTPG